MAKSIWGKLNEKIRLYGFPTLVKRVFKRGLAKAGFHSEVYYYCAFDLQDGHRLKPLPEGYHSRQLTMADLEKATNMGFSAGKLEVFRQRFRREGYTGIGIFKNDQLVGFAWLSLYEVETPFPLPDDGSLNLDADEGYLLDAYSHPDYRGRGFHPFYTSWRYKTLADTGRRYAITIIDEDNRAARTTQAKSGFRTRKKIRAKKTFNQWQVKVEPCSDPL